MDTRTPDTSADEQLRALIVDDEAPARERLRRMLAEIGQVTVVGEAANGFDALAHCAALDPDLVLLDVRMPGMDGIEAARHLGTLEDPPAVIFTTAYDEYALQAFETQAVGYLVKPIRREKLERAIRQAARVVGSQLTRIAEQSQLGRRRSQVCARLGDQLKLIPLGEVLYFSAGQKYVTVRHRGGRELIDESLRALEQEFAPDFVRIHRNSLVARQFVAAIERTAEGQLCVRFTGTDEVLPVSRRHATEALRQLRAGV
jgi:two-component system, LytTR family, response regulator AlgR